MYCHWLLDLLSPPGNSILQPVGWEWHGQIKSIKESWDKDEGRVESLVFWKAVMHTIQIYFSTKVLITTTQPEGCLMIPRIPGPTDNMPLVSPGGLVQDDDYSVSSVTQSCLTLCDPMNRSTPGLPVHHHLPEFTQTHVHRVCDAIQPSHPGSSPSPPAPNPSQHQSLLQWVKSSHEVAKVLEFQL